MKWLFITKHKKHIRREVLKIMKNHTLGDALSKTRQVRRDMPNFGPPEPTLRQMFVSEFLYQFNFQVQRKFCLLLIRLIICQFEAVAGLAREKTNRKAKNYFSLHMFSSTNVVIKLKTLSELRWKKSFFFGKIKKWK